MSIFIRFGLFYDIVIQYFLCIIRFLLVVDRTAAITEKANNAQKVLDNDIIKQTKAYKDGHIVYLDAANWYLAFGGLESMEIIAQELDRAVKK